MAKKARKAKAKARKSKAKAKSKKKGAKKAKKAKKKKARRTVMYSSKGKKLYAKRDASGKFKDIQSYQRAHSMDMKRSSKAEETAEAAAPAPTGTTNNM
jgi:hypothetical protein